MTIIDDHPASQTELDLAQAIEDRRSERRPFSTGKRVSPSDVELMQRLVVQYGALLHQVADDQRHSLAAAVANAAIIEEWREAYQHELLSWTDNRRPGEGLAATELANRSQTGPVHDSATRPGQVHAAFGEDTDADYLILATHGDPAKEWLRTGEALSIVWLTATTRGIAGSVLSNLSEVAGARVLAASVMPRPGQPQLVFRIGIPTWPAPPATPRRRPETVITVEHT